MRLASLTAAFAVVAATAAGAQETRTVRVRVTSVSARSVYLDAGRTAGLGPGQEVELMPQGSAPYRATIREVSATSARAEVPPGRPLPPVGTVGEVVAGDAPRGTAAEPKRAERETPAHPPWSLQDYPVGRTDDPLLAPAFGGGPASRPTTWNGRLFGQLTWAHDDSPGGGFESYRARLGARLEATNPFGLGGTLAFDGEVSRKSVDLFASTDATDDRARLDRLSYAWGDDDLEPWRVELGRFISRNVPEVGMLDGVEVLRRLSPTVAVGGGAGLAPLPFAERDTGDDVGVYAFLQWQPADPAPALGAIGGAIGFQQTWHLGEPDRDLLFARANWMPSASLRIDASALVDFYSGSDDLKTATAELTQSWLSATWNATDDLGLGLSASTYRWAQMMRADLAFVPPELVRDGHVERVSPRAWLDVADRVRLHARADLWRDQQRSGNGGEVGVDWGDFLGSGCDVALSGFLSEGSFQSGPGARFRLSRPFDWGWAGVRYEWNRWSADDLLAGAEDFTQHRVGVDVDLTLGTNWSALVNGEIVTGDGADAYSLGLFVQRRF